MTQPTAVRPTTETVADCDKVRFDTEHGIVTASMRTNWKNGRTLYVVAGPRISGCLTVFPTMWPGKPETSPRGVEVAFGDLLNGDIQRRYDNHDYYPNPTTINGVVVLGYNTTPIATVVDGTFTTYGRRCGSERANGRLPDAAQERLSSVVLAVLQHWLDRSDLESLKMIIARAFIPGLLRGELGKVKRLQDQIVTLMTERDLHDSQADNLRRFLVENGIDFHETP